MKIILETTYSGIDEEWLEWYFKRLESGPDFNPRVAKELRQKGSSHAETKDGTVTANTHYRIEK